MTEDQRACWDEILRRVAVNHLQPIDYLALVTLVLDFQGLLQADRQLRESGLLQRDVDHGMVRAHPLAKLYNVKRAALMDSLARLAFTPASRSACGIVPPEDDSHLTPEERQFRGLLG